MYKKKTGIVGIIITVVILVLLVFLSNIKTGSLSYIENVFSAIFMPVQTGYTYLKNKISGNTSFFTNMEDLKAENEELKEKTSKLEQELRELEIIKAENDTMKEYLGLTEKYADYESVPAYIISKDISNFSSTFVINVGKKEGIENNMTVISDQGLVGHVISVTETTAKVQTIIDSGSAVTANLSNNGESIICKGSLEKRNAKSYIYSDKCRYIRRRYIANIWTWRNLSKRNYDSEK